MSDCTVIPYNNFKERLRVQEELKREMEKKYGYDENGKPNFKLNILENCIMAEYRSSRAYF